MKKREPEAFEGYPCSTVFISNFVNLMVCVVGVYLVWQLGALWGVLFIVFLLGNEFFIYKHGCSCCYYYGKRCAFGRGKVARFFVKKDDPKKFCQRNVTWLNLLPVIVASLVPVIVGVILLIWDFRLFILILTLVPLLNWFVFNPLIFGRLGCLHCKQGRICCPANDFFSKKK